MHNVYARNAAIDLWIDLDTAKYCRGLEGRVLSIYPNALLHLSSQLAGWRKHQRSHWTVPFALGTRIEPLQQRQGKASSFSGSRLSTGKNIPALQN